MGGAMIAYKVKLTGRKKAETVHADYWRMCEGGVLVFRNQNPQQGYPIFVKAFAPGSWVTVTGEPAAHQQEHY